LGLSNYRIGQQRTTSCIPHRMYGMWQHEIRDPNSNTNSLTPHCCAWPAEGRSVLHIERSWLTIQAAPTDRPVSSSKCCSHTNTNHNLHLFTFTCQRSSLLQPFAGAGLGWVRRHSPFLKCWPRSCRRFEDKGVATFKPYCWTDEHKRWSPPPQQSHGTASNFL